MTVSPLPPAIILGGTENAVSVARSLSAAGIEVWAVGTPTSPVRYSRACAVYASPVGPGELQHRWLRWLQRGPGNGVLLPCDDDGLELIAGNRRDLVDMGYLPFEADDDVLLSMLDKDRTYTLARDAGIPHPTTFTLRTLDDISALPDDLPFPCALKPVHSHLFRHRTESLTKAVVVGDRGDLEAEAVRLLRLGLEMLVTEIIPGGEDQFLSYYSYLDEDGLPLLHFTKRRIRQNPPGFGRGCYHVTEWIPEVAELGLAFFQGVGLRGLGNIEFKRDARDGSLKLIECNHRFTASNEVARLAGMDFALFTYNRLIGRDGPDVRSYRSGVRIWHPVADLRSFRVLHRRGEMTVAEYVRSIAHHQHLPIFSLQDPLPAIGYNLARVLRRGRRRLRPPARRRAEAAEAGAAPSGPSAGEELKDRREGSDQPDRDQQRNGACGRPPRKLAAAQQDV